MSKLSVTCVNVVYMTSKQVIVGKSQTTYVVDEKFTEFS